MCRRNRMYHSLLRSDCSLQDKCLIARSPTRLRGRVAKSTNAIRPGDVVVSEQDLAEQLRRRPDTVATALSLLLGEQKVQKAPLNGYWTLNV